MPLSTLQLGQLDISLETIYQERALIGVIEILGKMAKPLSAEDKETHSQLHQRASNYIQRFMDSIPERIIRNEKAEDITNHFYSQEDYYSKLGFPKQEVYDNGAKALQMATKMVHVAEIGMDHEQWKKVAKRGDRIIRLAKTEDPVSRITKEIEASNSVDELEKLRAQIKDHRDDPQIGSLYDQAGVKIIDLTLDTINREVEDANLGNVAKLVSDFKEKYPDLANIPEVHIVSDALKSREAEAIIIDRLKQTLDERSSTYSDESTVVPTPPDSNPQSRRGSIPH